jgi:hypothetical protein
MLKENNLLATVNNKIEGTRARIKNAMISFV